MSSMSEKYNLVIHKIKDSRDRLKASDFDLEYDELIRDVTELLDGSFHLTLTFNGKSFLENNDSKEYHKIEKTEIHHNSSLNIENNSGIAVVGNNNIINTSEFNQKFTQLIQEIEHSNIGNKAQIIQDLTEKKDDSKSLKFYLYSLLSAASDASSVVSVIGGLLGIID